MLVDVCHIKATYELDFQEDAKIIEYPVHKEGESCYASEVHRSLVASSSQSLFNGEVLIEKLEQSEQLTADRHVFCMIRNDECYLAILYRLQLRFCCLLIDTS